MDLNDPFMRTILILCEDVVYNEISLYMLTQGMDLNELVVKTIHILCEDVVYNGISMYMLN